MYKLLSKYHNLILTALKTGISLLAVYYLWQHRHVFQSFSFTGLELKTTFFLTLIVFTALNWFFEIKKWQFLAGHIHPLSLGEAARQSLLSFAVSLLTPNRVGEYGAKVMFFDKKDYKKILSLTFIGNTAQLLLTLIVGSLALVFWLYKAYPKPEAFDMLMNNKMWFLLLLAVAIILMIWFKTIQKNSKEQLLIKQAGIWQQSMIYAGLRYLIFSSQFVWLFLFFNTQEPLSVLYPAVFVTYLFSTLIPMLSFLDWVVKGSVAVWFLSGLQIPAALIFKIVAIMWIANFLLPFFIGLILMWFYKNWKK